MVFPVIALLAWAVVRAALMDAGNPVLGTEPSLWCICPAPEEDGLAESTALQEMTTSLETIIEAAIESYICLLRRASTCFYEPCDADPCSDSDDSSLSDEIMDLRASFQKAFQKETTALTTAAANLVKKTGEDQQALLDNTVAQSQAALTILLATLNGEALTPEIAAQILAIPADIPDAFALENAPLIEELAKKITALITASTRKLQELIVSFGTALFDLFDDHTAGHRQELKKQKEIAMQECTKKLKAWAKAFQEELLNQMHAMGSDGDVDDLCCGMSVIGSMHMPSSSHACKGTCPA